MSKYRCIAAISPSRPCLTFNFRNACAIQFEESVVITGGNKQAGKAVWNIVQVYDQNGARERLPDLRTGRLGHACGHYVQNDQMVFNLQHIK